MVTGSTTQLVVTHTVTRAAHLDATVTDAAGNDRAHATRCGRARARRRPIVERQGRRGLGRSRRPLHADLHAARRLGHDRDPVSIDALVLTAVKLGTPSARGLLRPRRGRTGQDRTRSRSRSPSTAQVGFQVIDDAGNVVRTVRACVGTGATKLSFVWDGKTDDGSWAPDGWYNARRDRDDGPGHVLPGAPLLRGRVPRHPVDRLARYAAAP